MAYHFNQVAYILLQVWTVDATFVLDLQVWTVDATFVLDK